MYHKTITLICYNIDKWCIFKTFYHYLKFLSSKSDSPFPTPTPKLSFWRLLWREKITCSVLGQSSCQVWSLNWLLYVPMFYVIGHLLSEQLYHLCLYAFIEVSVAARTLSVMETHECHLFESASSTANEVLSCPKLSLWYLQAFAEHMGPLCVKCRNLSDGYRYFVTGRAAVMYLLLKAMLRVCHFALQALIPWY